MNDKISFWNNGAEELYRWSKKEALGKTLQDLLQTEYPEPLNKIKDKALSKGRWDGELIHTKRDGTKINVLSRWSLQKDSLNNPIGFMEVNIDITERKKATKKLKENEEKYRELVENANSIIIRLDKKGSILFFNEFAETFFGFREEEVKEKNIVGTIVPRSESYGRDLQELMNKIIKDPESYSYVENENITKEGKRVWVSWTNKGIFNKKGELQGILSIGTDVTERKKAEEDLKRSETILQEATRLSKVGAYEWDIKKDKFIFSREWRRIHGVEEKYLSSEELMNVSHPEDITKVKKALNDALKDIKQYDIEHRIINQLNGEVRYIHAMGTVLKDGDGNPIKMYGVADDITESKLAEIEREKLIKDLKLSNEELRQFAYITRHDLQEPLRTMGSYAGLLKHRYEGQLDQDADEFIEFMISGASRMKAMIQGLLDYSRIGTLREEFKNFNSHEAVDYAVSSLKSFIKENNAEITYDKLPVIYADENQIVRVFHNLIGNAIKFRKPDENLKIHVSARKNDDDYVFSVSDNSIGMEPEYTDKIFEIFKRLHAVGEYEGAGIGLAIVKRIIDRHGGRVWVKSKLGKGSTFYFTIPINQKNL
jgi:PAS domain S-box-containing protein